MALAAGLIGAALHFHVPMLALLASEFSATPEQVGLLPMGALGAYALGIFLLVPLGDRYQKRSLILWKTGLLVVAYLTAAAAPSLGLLVAAGVLIGVFGSAAQDIVPLAAQTAPDGRQGSAVGRVMTGLFLGILFGRVFGGLVTEHFGWRAVFIGAAVLTALLLPLLVATLPRTSPGSTLSWRGLMASAMSLYMRHAELRRAVTMHGLLLVAYAAFWATLAPMLERVFGLGPLAAGLFAIPGAAGSLISARVGRWSDAYGARKVAGYGPIAVAAAFVGMGYVQDSLAALIVATMLFDLGIRTSQVANQSRIYSLDRHAGARLNSVLFLHMFGGQAVGAIAGSAAWARWGWDGVITLCLVFVLGSLAVHFVRRR